MSSTNVLQLGALLRYTADPNQFWKIERLTPKSVWLARSDADGTTSALDKHWQFRRKTVLRDFHPA